ncbi:MAG: sensory histidine kinase AtoS [Methanoregula sp. PtaU1.Bin051]|nr:MAG: sensory histidine kinase AtoS [Methanoregula sp. PtaU1.Bin051]
MPQERESFEESGHTFRTLFENMPNGFAYCRMLYDETGNPDDFIFLQANRTFSGLTGLDNVTGKRITGVIPDIKQTAPDLIGTCGKVAQTGIPETFELDFKPLGKLLNISIYSPEKGFFAVVVEDITGRKKAEEALRESEEKMAMVMDNVPTLLAYMDADLRFVYMNKAYAEWFGRPEQDLIGKSLKDLLPADVFFRAIPYYQQVLGGREVGYESPTKDRDGRDRVLNVRLVPHFHGGEVTGFFAALDDITSRKNTEAAFHAMVRSMVGATGFSSLQNITRSISSWLGADCVMIGEIQPDKKTVRVLSMLLDGKDVTDFSYGLTGTPCENASEKGFCIYPDDVQDLFPHARDLTELNIRGYIGTALKNSEGDVMGILCVLTRKPIVPVPSLQEIMNIIAVKAAAEIERLRITAALKESEERFRMLLQHVPSVAVQGYRMDGTTQYWNDASARLYGYTAEEAVGRNLVDIIIPPEMRDEVRGAIRYMAESGQPIPASELSLMKKDGSRVAVFSSHAVIRKSGRDLELFCIDIDLTERKRAEEALVDEMTKRKILIDQSRDGIVTLDSEGKVYESNQRFADMLGYTPDEMKELHVWDWDAQIEREHLLEMIRTVDEAGDHFETRHRRKDGTVLDVEISTNAATFSGKKLIFCVVRDITGRKRMEEALWQANAKISMLNSITRHDVLNQLTILRAYLHLLKEDVKDPNSLAYIGKVEQAAKAIKWQIEFTRDYQHIGAQEPFWQVLSGIIGRVIPQLRTEGVEISADVGSVEIFADPLMEKVFYNLMENSLRHGERVTRMEFSLKKTQDELIIVYRDNGIGITAEEKKNLFIRGFGKHTGLGLFLSKEILSITGMKIAETGEPGKGVLFEITVPKGAWRTLKIGKRTD